MCRGRDNQAVVKHMCIVCSILSHAHGCMAPWYVAVKVLAVIGQPSKQVALVAHKSKAVSNPRAGKWAGPRSPGFQLFPQPASSLRHRGAKCGVKKIIFTFKSGFACLLRTAYLKFIQAIAVFSELKHAAKNQHSSALTHQAMRSTSRWDIPPHSR